MSREPGRDLPVNDLRLSEEPIMIGNFTEVFLILLLAILTFVYLLARLFLQIVRHLVNALTELKFFTMGVPQMEPVDTRPVYEDPNPPDDDFGDVQPEGTPEEIPEEEEVE